MKMLQKLHFSRRLLKKVQLTPDTIQLDFERGNFDFEAGNFITITVPSTDGIVARSYSILSAPHQKDIFSLCVKIIPGGIGSTFLANLQIGDELRFDGPFGIFKLPPKEIGQKLVFIATGVGVVPFVSIITGLWQENYTGEMVLYFGNRHEEDLIYVNLFEKISQKMPNFRFYVTLSQPSPTWDGLKGRVTEHLNDLDVSNGDFYICGNGDAVKSIHTLLQQKGAASGKLHLELFTKN
jgi:ferredoxin-NADP reductase